jgi:hypothetical protein
MNRTHISERPPGTYAAYRNDGCRCYRCSIARAAYDDRRTRAIIAGTWHPFTDVAPVRAHLELLSAHGVGLRTVRRLTGVSRSALQSMLYGTGDRKASRKIRTEHADAILAIRPGIDTAADSAHIDATGTRRRLRALVAIGFPADYLARRLHAGGGSNLRLYDEGETKVIAAKARAVRALYLELSGTDPAAVGIIRHSSNRSRNRAAAYGWPRPIDWDDDAIDDPEAEAVRAERLEETAVRLRHPVTPGEVEDAQWVIETAGLDVTTHSGRNSVASRLGIGRKRLEYILEKAAA